MNGCQGVANRARRRAPQRRSIDFMTGSLAAIAPRPVSYARHAQLVDGNQSVCSRYMPTITAQPDEDHNWLARELVYPKARRTPMKMEDRLNTSPARQKNPSMAFWPCIWLPGSWQEQRVACGVLQRVVDAVLEDLSDPHGGQYPATARALHTHDAARAARTCHHERRRV